MKRSTPVTDADVHRVRSFFIKAIDQFHLIAPTIVFTQLLDPQLAKVALQAEEYDQQAALSPQELSEFVANLIFDGPDSRQVLSQTLKLKQIYDSLDIPVTAEQFSFMAYALTHKLMQALERYAGIVPTQEEQKSWFRLITLTTERLGSTEITDDYDTFVRLNQIRESEFLNSPSDISRNAAKEALSQFTKPLPFALRAVAKPALLAVMEPELRTALQLPSISENKKDFYLSILKRAGALLNVRGKLSIPSEA